jgi:hypothetical protein
VLLSKDQAALVEHLDDHFLALENAVVRKNIALVIAISVLLSGCSTTQSLSADDFEPFYRDIIPAPSIAEIKLLESTNNQEFLELARKDYEKYASELEGISNHFAGLAKNFDSETEEYFVAAGEMLSALSGDFIAESNYLKKLIPTCPLTWDDSKRKEIEDCGRANLRWSHSIERAISCTYYFISLDFESLPEFDRRKVSSFGDYSSKELESCWIFKKSNSLFGYPTQLGVTWIPDRFQTKFLRQDQMFVVEIAENLYTASEGDLLTDALYGSWNGSCAVYKKYEALLRDGGYLLGSIKSGTCY